MDLFGSLVQSRINLNQTNYSQFNFLYLFFSTRPPNLLFITFSIFFLSQVILIFHLDYQVSLSIFIVQFLYHFFLLFSNEKNTCLVKVLEQFNNNCTIEKTIDFNTSHKVKKIT